MKLYSVIILLLVMNSCVLVMNSCDTISRSSAEISHIEKFSGIELRGKITFDDRTEQWMFGGDGEKTVLFSIHKEFLAEIMRNAREHNFASYKNPAANVFHYNDSVKFLKTSEDVYKHTEEKNEYITVIIDSTHCKLVYNLIII